MLDSDLRKMVLRLRHEKGMGKRHRQSAFALAQLGAQDPQSRHR